MCTNKHELSGLVNCEGSEWINKYEIHEYFKNTATILENLFASLSLDYSSDLVKYFFFNFQ